MTTQIPAGGRAREAQPAASDPADQTAPGADAEADAYDAEPTGRDDTERDEPRASSRAMGWLLLIGGLVGLFGSGALSIERILILEDPGHTPSCSFNPLVSCGEVMQSWQGALFGFPNPFIGVATFPVVMALGALLLSGVRLPRWMALSLWGGTIFGAGLVTWLFTQSVYMIGKLCPYCMIVWVAMIPIFVYTTGYVLSERHLPAPARLRRAIVGNRGLIVFVWLVAIAIFIGVEFRDQWDLVF